MSAVTTVAPPRAHDTALERDILRQIARGGLLICEAELRYQLHRHGLDHGELLDVLSKLEEDGLLESAMHFRLTDKGRKRVPRRPPSRSAGR
jgi:DNA-binding PadR family transcriptional regulator